MTGAAACPLRKCEQGEGSGTEWDTWAAGMADYRRGRVVVATNEPARVIPLLRWEYRNFKLIEGGRVDLAY